MRPATVPGGRAIRRDLKGGGQKDNVLQEAELLRQT